MGGGVGISCHGSHRIVGENSIISMPECGIGLVPDVGGSFLLARLEKNVGAYLGTTAFRMDAGDSIFCKFADHYIPIEQWPHTIKELATHGDVEYAINKYQRETPKSQLRQIVPIIEEVMQPNDYSRLEERMSKYSQLAIGLNNLKRNSPLSVAFTYSMLKMPEVSRDIESAIGIEYRYTSRAQEETDFLEGIRAMVIDKDRAPQWKHKSLSEVKIEEITALLAPLNN
jgi:enoyl-CoA hydratase